MLCVTASTTSPPSSPTPSPRFDTSQVHSLTRPNIVSVGTIVWLSSELMFFAGLFAMYFSTRAAVPDVWARDTVHLNVIFGSINTTVLVLSSVTCQMGVWAAERFQPARSGALWQVSRDGDGTFIDLSMTHAIHASNVVAQATLENAESGMPGAASELRAGLGLLNGGVPCYNVYRTADARWLAVGALELKFWEKLCRALARPDWASRHWSLGQAIGGADAVALTRELAERFASRRLDAWIELLEPLDCSVSPVLTVEEARNHVLFNPDAEA